LPGLKSAAQKITHHRWMIPANENEGKRDDRLLWGNAPPLSALAPAAPGNEFCGSNMIAGRGEALSARGHLSRELSPRPAR
jgi:hypothetical protein